MQIRRLLKQSYENLFHWRKRLTVKRGVSIEEVSIVVSWYCWKLYLFKLFFIAIIIIIIIFFRSSPNLLLN